MGNNVNTYGNSVNASDEHRDIVVFKPSSGETGYEVILDESVETIWATELQISQIFDRDRTVINRHIKNIFKEGELKENSTSAKIAQVRKEGERDIQRDVTHYNLDVIISIGYRVKSPKVKYYILRAVENQQIASSETVEKLSSNHVQPLCSATSRTSATHVR